MIYYGRYSLRWRRHPFFIYPHGSIWNRIRFTFLWQCTRWAHEFKILKHRWRAGDL